MRAVIAGLCLVPSLALAQPAPAPAPAPPSPAEPVPSEPTASPAPAEAVPTAAPAASDATAPEATAAESPAGEPPPASTLPPIVPRFPQPPTHRLALELEIYGDGNYVSRAGTNLSQVRLDRGEAGAAVRTSEHTGAELRLETVRSAAEGGALGIDGDSLVMRIKRAQVYGDWEHAELRLDGAFGMTPDPWIASLEDRYTVRPLSATASERLLGWPTSDLAALGRASYGPARLTVSIGNGEGQRYPERNTGKTTTAVAEVVALDDPHIRLAAMVRDGSVGPASTRERRYGGSATLSMAQLSAGAEVVHADGVGDHGEVTANVIGGWAEARPYGPLVVAARVATAGYDGGRATTGGGAIAVMRGKARVWLAIDRTTSSGTAMPLPTDAGTGTTFQLIVSSVADYFAD